MKIKFLTLNIEHGGILFDDVVSFIKSENPDIFALQEVQDSDKVQSQSHQITVQLYKKIFSEYHFRFAPESMRIIDGARVLHGNATYSRFPIISHREIFFDIPFGEISYKEMSKKQSFHLAPHNVLETQIDVAPSLFIYNLHGIWGKGGKDNDARTNMGKKVIESFKGKKNVILTGDFNMLPNTQTINNIEKYLTNVFKDELTSTFNMKRKPVGSGYATSVVDMMFVSPSMRVVDHYQPKADVSDHYPLVATLEIN